jgi:hypothetical protein
MLLTKQKDRVKLVLYSIFLIGVNRVWILYPKEGNVFIRDRGGLDRMGSNRNLKEEIKELNILSIEGTGLLTEKAIFSAFDAIKESNIRRDEADEWRHIKKLQDKRTQRMERDNIG